MTSRQPSGGSTLERALLALEKMEAKLLAAERAKTEPLAIIGLGCRLPGGVRGPSTLWQMLRAGIDAVTEVPPERWAPTTTTPEAAARWAGLLDHVDQFDAPFFGIGRNEAADMDPQQRLLLEVTWEALEDAAIPPDRLLGSKTGVFVGTSTHDYADLLAANAPEPRAYVPTGISTSFVAGRIAHHLGLRGPTTVIDAACASSLVCLHLACQSLRRGECDLAIVGGVNLLLSPHTSNLLSALQILSPDGRCRTFDARANGYVRAEGVGVVVLERLSDAQRRENRIWALVRGSAMNQSGRSTSLTAPNAKAQAACVRAALEDARIGPERVGYVEVHSNGSPLGDPVELEALREALGPPRPDGSKCVLGSIKTRIGHAEAASGMASLIKTVLVLNHETIPVNLHFESLNPNASIDGTPFVFPTSELRWRRGATPRIAGVSSTGLSGANAHAVLEEPPRAQLAQDKPERPLHLFVLSAKTPEALRDRAKQMLHHVSSHPDQSLGDICHTLGAGRAHFEHRFAAVVGTVAEVTGQLADFMDGAPSAYVSGRVEGGPARKRVAFVLDGTAAQAAGALGSLAAAPPALRAAAERADEAVQAHLGRHVLPILHDEGAARAPLDAVDAELALFALQYALVELWGSWGIEPAAVIGQGTGECVAAWAAGMLDLPDAVRLAAARARLLESEGRDVASVAQALASVKLGAPKRNFLPSLGGAFSASSLGTTTYWERQVREGMSVGSATNDLAAQGYTALLEIGPAPVLATRTAAPPSSPVFPSLRPSRPPIRVLHETLAALYVRGVEIRFTGMDAPHPYRRIALPTYPFQRQKYWFGEAARSAPQRPATDGHPLLGHALEPRADRPETRTWQVVLDDASRRSIGVQRVAGTVRLSSGGLVEVACAAARELFGNAAWEVDLSLGDPPVLHEHEPGMLQVIATPEGPGKASVGIFCRERDASPWRRIAHGKIAPTYEAEEESAPPSMRPGRRQGVPTALWERRFEAFGVDTQAFRVDQLWRRDVETLARVTLESGSIAAAVLRAATAIASITHPAAHGRAWMIEAVEGVNVRPTSLEGRAWLRLNWISNDGFTARMSMELVGESRELSGVARRIDVRAEDPAAALRAAGKEPLEGAFVEMVWREMPPPMAPAAAQRRWVVIADAGGVGASLAAKLDAAGDIVVTLPAAGVQQRVDDLALVLGISGPFFGVVYLGALDAAPDDSLSDETLEQALQKGSFALLSVVELLAAQVQVPRLWIVTRGAQAAGGVAAGNFAQAGPWGLGRVLSLERPDMWGGMIDLDPAPNTEEGARLAQILAVAGSEDHLALRGDKRYVARLTRAATPVQEPIEVRPDRTYLLTGAESKLGIEAAHWLVTRGARSLLLVTAATPSDTTERDAAVRALEARGAKILLAQADLTRADVVREALSLATSKLGGVVHAAHAREGGLHRLTSRDSLDALRAAQRQTLLALFSLHAATATLPLDFFIVFSSAPAALGWEGLGADAVGAEYASGLARLRARAGLPATVVHLSFSEEHRAGHMEYEDALLAAGLQGMPPPLALQAAELLASGSPTSTLVAWADWDLFEQSHHARTDRPLFEVLGEARGARTGTATLRRRVAAAELDKARWLVENVVRGEVARVLDLNPTDTPPADRDLLTLGMDSIMGVQLLTSLGAAFGVHLPTSALLTRTTIEGLSQRILGNLRTGDDGAATGPLSRGGLLVEFVREGTRTPFFMAPPSTGSALVFQSLAKELGPDQPFYGFNAPGVDTAEPPCDRIEVIAARYLEELRKVQPRGPYRLGGYSFGSLAAFEMAQVLRRAGERVEALVLGDMPEPSHRRAVRSSIVDLADIFDLPADTETLAASTHEELLTMVAAAVGIRLMLPSTVGESERQLRIFRAHLSSVAAYVPSPYDGPVTLLRAQESARSQARTGVSPDDPSLGWQTVCTQTVRVLDVPGDHYTMFLAPCVTETARALRQVLDELDGR
ncbi:type I polyketide synthase [Polyangium jinanense]|uniref:KR domain-containing protein n=1 Tax=Polyangium jinanense TaxID=2829994 RepID=A0A9X4AQ83_9BACT|nr:type I polyketide synthase [Polyangium jinanense]MDC3954536.1 KR domain-containing protein [Polyangium jinanense]MDC3980839.1 KR domain-containing protein [Polyangium jinanense]